MKAAVISLGSTSSKWTVKAMKNYFKEVDDLDILKIEVTLGEKEGSIMYDGKPLGDYDCIYAKGSFRYASILQAITTARKDKAYMPLTASAFTVGHDKLLTHLELQRAKVPMPKTYISSTTEAAKNILKMINYPIIMKFPQGTHGKGVMFAESLEAAATLLDALEALNQPFLIQEYIETSGVDTRAIVIGDKVVAAMKRKAIEGEKRANIHAGGAGEACVLDAHTKKIAVESAKAIGAEICAVDILEGPKGPVVIETNLSPGLQGITKVTGIDIADKIAKFLYQQAKSQTESSKKEGTSKIMGELGIGGEGGEKKQLITTLDIRGDKIVIPGVITKATGFNEKDDVSIEAEKGRLLITNFDVGKD